MNFCIFVFRFKISETDERVMDVLADFHKYFRIKKISSVFRKTTEATTRLDEEMSFAIVAETAIELENISVAIDSLKSSNYKFDLVAFNSEALWTPDLPIPSPLLHFDPLVLHCCAEIAPDYVHPILKEELKTLDIKNITTDFEFLFQGKIYIEQLT